MPRPKSTTPRKDMPVRITGEAMKWARIVASFRGVSTADYVSSALLETAKRDYDAEHIKLGRRREANRPEDGPKPKGRAKEPKS